MMGDERSTRSFVHTRERERNRQDTSSSLALALRMETKKSLLASWYLSKMSATDRLAEGGAGVEKDKGVERRDEWKGKARRPSTTPAERGPWMSC